MSIHLFYWLTFFVNMCAVYSNNFGKIISSTYQQIRWLPRWSHRRPVKVIPADEYDKEHDIHIKKPVNVCEERDPEHNLEAPTKINWKQPKLNSLAEDASKTFDKTFHKKNVKPLTISKSKKTTVDMLETIINSDGNFIYTKMKNNDSRISSILVNIKSKKEKEKKDLILLEGKRLIKEALDAGCKLEYILFSRIKEVQELKGSLPKMGAKLFKMPYREMQIWSGLVTNPGIMGIFKIPDTNLYTPCSSSLPLTVICDNVREPTNLGAILRTCSGVGCEKVILTKGCVNLWDSKVLRSAAGAHFKLQINKKLNWVDIRENIDNNSVVYIADNRIISGDSNEPSNVDNLAELIQMVPLLPYYGVDFRTARHIVLIIGGETEGISDNSYKLASELKGVRLNVPLSNNIESLNTGTALGIIAFEIKRQLSVVDTTEMESNCLN